MPITRTKISDDFIEPDNTTSRSSCNETRTRISDDFIEPDIGFCGRRVTRTPIHTYRLPAYAPPVFTAPTYSRPVYTAPSYTSYTSSYEHTPVYSSTPRQVTIHSSGDIIAGVLGLTILVVGFVALLALVPNCHTEKVCTAIGNGLNQCHLEKVCSSWL